MSSKNKVSIDLIARDLATPTFKGLGSTIRDNVLSANLLSSAITTGLGAATQVVNGLTNALKEASRVQIDNVGLVADISSITDKAFSATQEEVRQIGIEVEKIGNNFTVADSTIAEVQRGFLDDIYQANKGMGKGIDQITKDAGNLLPRIATMAEKSNFSASEAARFSSQFINGQLTEGQLKNLDFFNRNKLFMGTVEKYLESNGKSLKDLSKQELYTLYQAGVNAQVTDDYVREAGKTIKGIWNSFSGKLFGEHLGLLSLSRDLDSQTEGAQTALAAITEGLDLLIGEKGLITVVGSTLKTLGVELGDPMVGLRNSVLDFNEKINWVRAWFTNLNRWLVDQGDKPQQRIEKLGKQLEEWLVRSVDLKLLPGKMANWFNGLLDGASKTDWSIVFSTFGTIAAKVFNMLGDFINRIDYGRVVAIMGRILQGMFVGIGNFLANLNWGTLLQAAGIILAGAIIGGIGVGAVAIVASLGAIPIAAGLAIAGLIAVIVAKWGEISSFFIGKWSEITAAASATLDRIKTGWDELLSAAQSKWTEVTSTVTGFFDSVSNWFNGLLSRIPGLGGGSQSQPVGNKASGYIPSGASGLLAAAVREKRQMPAGSNLLVANSSEAVLTRQQQSNLASNLSQTRGGGLTIGQITIHTQATNAKEMANDLMGELMSAYDRYASNRLTTTPA